jgi:hypothetical protein
MIKYYILLLTLFLCINVNGYNYSCNGSNGRLPSYQSCCDSCFGCKFFYDNHRIRGTCASCKDSRGYENMHPSASCDDAKFCLNNINGNLECGTCSARPVPKNSANAKCVANCIARWTTDYPDRSSAIQKHCVMDCSWTW